MRHCRVSADGGNAIGNTRRTRRTPARTPHCTLALPRLTCPPDTPNTVIETPVALRHPLSWIVLLLALAFGPSSVGLAAPEPSSRVLAGHAGGILALAFAPGGRLLASGGEDQTIRLWNVGTGREAAVLRGHTGPVRALGFSPD